VTRGRQYSFGVLAVAMLNYGIRPVLAQWHPALEDWEARRPPERSRSEHERAWELSADLRAALDSVRDVLTQYAGLMASACGVPDLTATAGPQGAMSNCQDLWIKIVLGGLRLVLLGWPPRSACR
jgi:hypothetical protein